MDFRQLMTLGAIATSLLASITFLVGISLAYAHGDAASQPLYNGAVISNFSTVISFWLGSSAGSQKKDERLTPPSTTQGSIS